MRATLALFLLFSLTGCGNPSEGSRIQIQDHATHFSGVAMTMTYKVIIGKVLDNATAEHVESTIREIFFLTNFHLNKWNSESELSQINRLKENTPVKLSPLLLRLFKETDEIYKLTEGRFDPTIEPLQSLWKDKIAKGGIPSQEELNAIGVMVGWNKIVLEGNTITKLHPGTQFDFGGIAKGLCIDLICEGLDAIGLTDYYVEWGGEIRAAGIHPEERPWKIFIARLNDTDPENAIDTVELKNQAIATSGDYLQFWSIATGEGEETVFHIFDPIALRPLKVANKTIASVSVLAHRCAFADGIATAAMMFSNADDAKKWSESVLEVYPSTLFWIVTRP